MSQHNIEQANNLQQAFTAFNRMSVQLESSYRDLENKVSDLKEELAAARSERLQQLAEKEKLADRLEHLLYLLPGGVLLLDAQGIITKTNPMAEELLQQKLPGKNWSVVMSEHFDQGMTDCGEVTLKSGKHVTLSRRSLDAEPGQIVLLMDVSEQHELKTVLNRQDRLAAMGEMAASLAHQIRTPLSTALLYASNFQNESLSQVDRERMSFKVVERLKHLEHMVNDMLRFTRGSSIVAATIELSELFEEFSKIIEPQIEQVNGCLTLPSPARSLQLQGDQDALVGVLLNLANNSIQATGKNVAIDINIKSVNDGQVVLLIRDNGPGISAEIAEKIFTPFFTTRTEGTGLGLAVAEATMRAHHGGIRCLHQAKGAAFEITMSLADNDNMLPSGINHMNTSY